ncbi:hypothetical protein Q9966_014586 [Columba livia]|nr:hypothetical protein Q9966_014586 [Columba livia]
MRKRMAGIGRNAVKSWTRELIHCDSSTGEAPRTPNAPRGGCMFLEEEQTLW